MIYSKSLVEKIPLGQYNLSITNTNHAAFWNEGKQLPTLLGIVLEQANQVIKLGLTGAGFLRLIILTSDLKNETVKWSRELNEPWRDSSEGAVGQTLTWLDERISSIYSVIILREEIGLALLSEDMESKSWAHGIFVHELAHIHDNCTYLQIIGSEPIPQQGNWESHRQFLARSLWAEFFAETYAYPYLKSYDFLENIKHNVVLLEDAVVSVNKEMLAFQSHRNAGRVWSLTESKLSPLFNHLGRSMAVLVLKEEYKNDDFINKFIVDISLVSLAWGQIVRKMLDVFSNSDKRLNVNMLDDLEKIVDDGFRSFGLEPNKNN